MRSGGCGTDFFLSFNIGGVLGNYAMKFEIQSGAHWDLLEILVRKFKHGNQLVL